MSYLHDVADRIRRSVPTSLLPEGDLDALFMLYALLAETKGAHVTGKDVHDAWVVWMTLQDRSHRSMVPFAELSPDVQRADDPYVRAIRQAVLNSETR